MNPRKQINWHDFNYPPGLRIVHVNIDELDEGRRIAARFSHWTFIATLIALIFNFFSNFVLLFGSDISWTGAVNSFFMFVMISSLALYVFFSGFRALGFGCPSRGFKYILLQLSMNVFYYIAAISDHRNFQGISNWETAKMSDMSFFWRFTTISESCMWFVISLLSLISCFLVYRSQRHKVEAVKSAVALRNIV
ncbi:hypothetical protein P9112_001044 [Eukaryota sp. TZLM1-RC]